MPYLDTGPLFECAARRLDWTPPARSLGPVFSDALRDLHDADVLELRMTGDTKDAYRLADDPAHRFSAFSAVVFHSEPQAISGSRQ